MQRPKTYKGHVCSFYLDTIGTIKMKCFMKKSNFNTWVFKMWIFLKSPH